MYNYIDNRIMWNCYGNIDFDKFFSNYYRFQCNSKISLLIKILNKKTYSILFVAYDISVSNSQTTAVDMRTEPNLYSTTVTC